MVMGRPEKEIDWEMVDRHARAGCTTSEIIASCKVSVDTFYVRFKKLGKGDSFAEYRKTLNNHGEGDLRLMQYAKAMNSKAPGNAQMLIFLGKVRLKQDDTPVAKMEANNQAIIDMEHKNIELQAEIERLRAELTSLQNVSEAE